MTSSIGSLTVVPALGRPDLLAVPVARALAALGAAEAGGIGVAEIDPEVADTAAFCERYGVSPATTRADVNNVARRELDVRKASFAAMDVAVAESGMEYGGITPLGLPAAWPVLVDAAVADTPFVVIGSGVRRSKLVLAGKLLASLPGVRVIEGLAR